MKLFLFFIEGALLVCALVATAIVLSILGSDTKDLAAWIQAVGSVAALAIAIFVMNRQNKNSIRLMVRQNRHAAKLVADADRMTTLRKVDSVNAILGRYHRQLRIVGDSLAKPATSQEEIQARTRAISAGYSFVKNMHSRLQEIPAYDIGSFDLAQAILQFTEAVNECHAGLEIICRATVPRITPEILAAFGDYVFIAKKALSDYEAAAQVLKASSPTSDPAS
jgi:hypothetical protein